MSFLDFLKSSEFSQILIAILFGTLIGVYIMGRTLLKELKTTRGEREKFYTALEKKFDLGLVKCFSDIDVLANTFNIGRPGNIINLLENYLRYLLDHSDDSTKKDFIRHKYDLILGLLIDLKDEDPFADVPSEEKRLLQAIKCALRTNDTTQALAGMKELSSIIIVRNRTYKTISSINKAAVPLAIIGIFFTFIFGILR